MTPDLVGLPVERARQLLEDAGWRIVGRGDWATVLADPGDTTCVRLVPWDPAYRLYADDVLAGAGNHWLPRVDEVVDLAGVGYAVVMERLWPADADAARDFCASWERPDPDRDLRALGERVAALLACGALRYPWTWGGSDVHPGNVMVDGSGVPKLIDPLCLDGAALVRAIRSRDPLRLAAFTRAELAAFSTIPCFHRDEDRYADGAELAALVAGLDLDPGATLQEGDRVALLVPGGPAYLDAAMSLLARGVFPIPLDPRLTPSERERILTPLAPRLVVETAAQLTAVTTADRELPRGRPMHCTSGTTGVPKGVDSGLLSPADAAALVAEERELWGFGPDDVNLVLSPLYHSAPLRFATGTLLAGGRVVVLGAFDPEVVTAVIGHERPTTMFCVPTHLQRLFAHWDDVGVPDLSCFRLVAHAGAPCPTAVKRRLIELFPDGSTWEFYGSTEGQFTACRSEEWLARPGTVGRARPGRTLTLDDDGTIWCAVPPHARFSYVGDPEKTAAAWRATPDGPAFTVGDLGRLDADGYLWLDGRRTDLIISGGVNVYPLEVELVLGEHPGVDDVAVYAVDDPRWGQRVCAAVVGTATETELVAHAREHLAPPKRPKTWTFLDELPRTLTGKIRRQELPSPKLVEWPGASGDSALVE